MAKTLFPWYVLGENGKLQYLPQAEIEEDEEKEEDCSDPDSVSGGPDDY